MAYTLVYHDDSNLKRTFEKKSAEAHLAISERKQKPMWVIPEGADYIFEDGEIKPKKLTAKQVKANTEKEKADQEAKESTEEDKQES